MKTRVGVWIDHRQIATKGRQYFQAKSGRQESRQRHSPRCASLLP